MDRCTVNPGFEDSVKQECGQTNVRTATRREARAVQPDHQPHLFNLATVPRYSKPSPLTIEKTPRHSTLLCSLLQYIYTRRLFFYCHHTLLESYQFIWRALILQKEGRIRMSLESKAMLSCFLSCLKHTVFEQSCASPRATGPVRWGLVTYWV